MEPHAGLSPDTWTPDIEQVLPEEHKRINAWREARGRSPITPAVGRDTKIYDTNGLALSGGGIRSAAFCLGVLQALDGEDAIKQLDYLSTVSGGGYIGASLTAGMNANEGKFPFRTGTDDWSDNHAVAHIRNYSNYLAPRGLKDIIASLTVLARGLCVNLAIVAGIILVLAGLTCLMNPTQENMVRADIFGWEQFPFNEAVRALGEFPITKLLSLIGVAYGVIWGLARSWAEWTPKRAIVPEFSQTWFNGADVWHRVAYGLLLLIALTAFLEVQPYAIRDIYELRYPLEPPKPKADALGFAQAAAQSAPQFTSPVLGRLAVYMSSIAQYLAPVAAALAFFSKYFGDIIKTKSGDSAWQALAMRIASKAGILLIALTLPLLIWALYLHAAIFADIGFIFRPEWMQSLVSRLCHAPDAGEMVRLHAALVKDAAEGFVIAPLDTKLACKITLLIPVAYLLLGGLILLAAIFILKPNANSLHRLYRDRLSKAFLFDPTKIRTKTLREIVEEDPPSLDTLGFGNLESKHGPLHLINAALNVQGSRYANKRGRQADFFFFSPAWCGSVATGFMRTATLVKAEPALDIATAMAISGAAVSSNIGTNTVRGLAPTLALLNIRLGYWMRNPRRLHAPRSKARLAQGSSLYLAAEIFSLLDEGSGSIYLTDGGHIENLGLFELLRRRCKTIIVIDAEADPNLNFKSLIDLQRYARIDLGIRIDLPWQAIREEAMALNAKFEKDDIAGLSQRAKAAHCAVGEIMYDANTKGVLLYLKATMTGDESDMICNYKARNPAFPHESTGDQFFSEEQFEVYRALGNHAMRKALKGEAFVEGIDNLPGYHAPPPNAPQAFLVAARKAAFDRVLA